jgi:hypothetical protein
VRTRGDAAIPIFLFLLILLLIFFLILVLILILILLLLFILIPVLLLLFIPRIRRRASEGNRNQTVRGTPLADRSINDSGSSAVTFAIPQDFWQFPVRSREAAAF